MQRKRETNPRSLIAPSITLTLVCGPACPSCKGAAFMRRGQNYCTRCAPMIRLRNRLKKWNARNPKTWVGCPPSFRDTRFYSGAAFRTGVKMEVESRLRNLRRAAERRNGLTPIYGLDIEHQLRGLVALRRPHNRHAFHNLASFVDYRFKAEQSGADPV